MAVIISLLQWNPVQTGTYQPVASNLINVAAMTIDVARFVRNGNWVKVWGLCNVTPTLALNNTLFDFTLPVGTIALQRDLFGLTNGIGTASDCGVIYGTPVALATWRVVPPTAFAINYVYSFDYVIS